MDEGDGVILAGRELRAQGGGLDGLAPFDLESAGGEAAALGDVEPLVREGAVHAAEHLFLHDVPQGTLHHAPGAAGADVDRVARVEERLQVGLDRLVERDKVGAAMADHRLRHRAQRFF